MRENGSPDPIFETDADRHYLTITLPVHPLGASGAVDDAATPRDAEEVGRLLSDPRLIRVLKLATSPQPRSALQASIGLRSRTRFSQAVLRPLIHAGLLAATIPDKPRAHTQRYQTTERGLRLIEGASVPANEGR
jgi:ATP-dependent DNA helicase RecG